MNQCSLCAGEVGPDGVIVCGTCQRRGATPIRATGEFMAVAPPHDLAEAAAPPAPGTTGCTWCGKDGAAVRKLLGNGTVSICNECVALCADVMEAELGNTWRG
jgi:hypothetical protein